MFSKLQTANIVLSVLAVVLLTIIGLSETNHIHLSVVALSTIYTVLVLGAGACESYLKDPSIVPKKIDFHTALRIASEVNTARVRAEVVLPQLEEDASTVIADAKQAQSSHSFTDVKVLLDDINKTLMLSRSALAPAITPVVAPLLIADSTQTLSVAATVAVDAQKLDALAKTLTGELRVGGGISPLG